MIKPIALLQDQRIRLLLFGMSAVLAVYFGFIGLDVETAGMLVKLYGYYFILATFALWGVVLWHLWRQRVSAETINGRECLAAFSVIALFSVMAVTAEPFRSKILFDEYVLQSTAYNMHYFRDTATMVRGYDLLGVFSSLDNYLDKRPNFYPFLISLVHDFTGYRSANAYWLNAALYPVSLALAYYLGRRLMLSAFGGMLAVLLLGSLPLLSQNATGSGMELLNFSMILAVTALSAAYLRAPDMTSLSALVLGAILLAQSRYESAIYVLPVAIIVLIGWYRKRAIVLSWITIIAPLLLLPCALQNLVLNNTRWLWQLKDDQASRFSSSYLMRNLENAGDFLFGRSSMYANSFTLTVLGVLGLACIAWRLIFYRQVGKPEGADTRLAVLLFCGGAIANTVLIMFYYWSSFNDPMAARFSLPLHYVFAFTVVMGCAAVRDRWPRLPVVVMSLSILAAVVATSRTAQSLYSQTGIEEIEWEKRLVAARPSGTRLIISNKSTLPWLLEKIPSILIGRAILVADRVQFQLKENLFSEILVMQSLKPTTREGDHRMSPDDKLPEGFELELIAERRFGTKITRISRLVAVHLPPAAVSKPLQVP